MNFNEAGEARVIAAMTKHFPQSRSVALGIGDDCAAVLPLEKGWLQLLKTDAVVEGVHFLPDASMALVGRKAMARAVSDIASMGGIPESALLTVAFPDNFTFAKAGALARGAGSLAGQFGVTVIGGETVRSTGPLFVSVTLTGRVEHNRIISRSGGKPGHVLFVTGKLGGSIRGHHFRFTPRVHEGRWLATHCRPSAMMDLSDGLAADLPRLASSSHCGFELDLAQLPLRRGATTEGALTDGEDYELLFSVPSSAAQRLPLLWAKQFPKTLLTRIGHFTKTGSTNLGQGFDHFQ